MKRDEIAKIKAEDLDKALLKAKKELFKYIKQSGISSGKIYLNYTKAKELYLNYNLDYLEFEVIFVVGSAYFFSG